MAHTWTIATVLLLMAVLVHSDSAVQPALLHVAYLGRLSEGEDGAFQRFKGELAHMPADLRPRIRFLHVKALVGPENHLDEESVTKTLAMNPVLVVAPSTATAAALRRRHSSTPVVFTSFTDPIRDKIVTALGPRDEPFAGVWMEDALDPKRLEILRDAYPGIRTVAVLGDRAWEKNTQALESLPAFGRGLGLDVRIVLAENMDEANRQLDTPDAQSFDAWSVPPTGLANLHGKAIIQRIQRWKKPLIMGYAADVDHGAPIAYMSDNSFRWPAIMDLTARVLQGERPGSIPIQKPYKTILAVRPLPAGGFPPPAAQIVQRADQIYR